MLSPPFTEGRRLLLEPVLPLVSMVHFLYLTGPFTTVAEVIAELPEPITTGFAHYEKPRALLLAYLDLLRDLEALKTADQAPEPILDEHDQPLDRGAATLAIVLQNVLTRELEAINAALCAPCHCTLCCVGPDKAMEQAFFEIPLLDTEVSHFSLRQIDTAESRQHQAMDTPPLLLQGQPFYQETRPLLVHWRSGWSLILPRETRCPHLDGAGRCAIYDERPRVCRRPQLFAYILEQQEGIHRLRNTLLGVMDCPFVQALREEIADFAAASELHCVFRQNKQ